jgi:Winged helix-turn helix
LITETQIGTDGPRHHHARWSRRSPDALRRTLTRIQLSDAEAQRLERAFRLATDRNLLDRLQIVRLAHRGRKHQDIAVDLGITPRTVQRWLNAYLEGGLAALKSRKAKGHAPAIPAEIAEEIRRWVINDSTSQGLAPDFLITRLGMDLNEAPGHLTTWQGEPPVRLDPIQSDAQPRRGGQLKGKIWVAEDFAAPDFEIANPCNSGEP